MLIKVFEKQSILEKKLYSQWTIKSVFVSNFPPHCILLLYI